MTHTKERAASYTCIEPAGQMMREVIDKLERLEADHRDALEDHWALVAELGQIKTKHAELQSAYNALLSERDELDRIVNRQVGQTLAEVVTALVRRAKKGERLEKKEGR